MSREGLADVLTALTGRTTDLNTTNITPCEGVMCSHCGGSGDSDERCGRCGSTGCYSCEAGCNGGWWPWTVESPEAAVEILSERGLWPWAPGDPSAPRWWCETCKGTRLVGGGWVGTEYQDTDLCETCGRDDPNATGGVTADGTTADTPSLAALVAVASLGVATLRRVAELVRELHAVTKGETGAVLVFRVMTREALRELHAERGKSTFRGVCAETCWVFSYESSLEEDQWPEEYPYDFEYDFDNDPEMRAAWPILRALAIHEDGTPTGLHLVAADRERVVIGVEAL